METKVCNLCKEEKPISEFSRQYRDGSLHRRCKECTSTVYRDWYAKKGRSRAKDYRQLISVWKRNHPEVVNATGIIVKAIRKGELSKPLSCVLCGRESRINAHHDDYNKPFDILWVCSSCHKKLHLGLMKSQEV